MGWHAALTYRRLIVAYGVQRIIISAWEGHLPVTRPDGTVGPGQPISTGNSVLAVFQRGQQIWSCAATAQVFLDPARHPPPTHTAFAYTLALAHLRIYASVSPPMCKAAADVQRWKERGGMGGGGGGEDECRRQEGPV